MGSVDNAGSPPPPKPRRRPRQLVAMGPELDARIEAVRTQRHPALPRAILLRAILEAGLPAFEAPAGPGVRL